MANFELPIYSKKAKSIHTRIHYKKKLARLRQSEIVESVKVQCLKAKKKIVFKNFYLKDALNIIENEIKSKE